MSNHPLEPWHVGGHPRDKSGTDWREVLGTGPFGDTYICQALEPDARLIAAAPEMRAALANLIANEYGAESVKRLCFDEARALLARIDGPRMRTPGDDAMRDDIVNPPYRRRMDGTLERLR